MTFKEAWEEMLKGKKIRCANWDKDKYIFFADSSELKSIIYHIPEWLGDEWELYKEPTEYFGWSKAYELLVEGKKLCFKGMENICPVMSIPIDFVKLKGAGIYGFIINKGTILISWQYISIFTEEPIWYEYEGGKNDI